MARKRATVLTTLTPRPRTASGIWEKETGQKGEEVVPVTQKDDGDHDPLRTVTVNTSATAGRTTNSTVLRQSPCAPTLGALPPSLACTPTVTQDWNSVSVYNSTLPKSSVARKEFLAQRSLVTVTPRLRSTINQKRPLEKITRSTLDSIPPPPKMSEKEKQKGKQSGFQIRNETTRAREDDKHYPAWEALLSKRQHCSPQAQSQSSAFLSQQQQRREADKKVLKRIASIVQELSQTDPFDTSPTKVATVVQQLALLRKLADQDENYQRNCDYMARCGGLSMLVTLLRKSHQVSGCDVIVASLLQCIWALASDDDSNCGVFRILGVISAVVETMWIYASNASVLINACGTLDALLVDGDTDAYQEYIHARGVEIVVLSLNRLASEDSQSCRLTKWGASLLRRLLGSATVVDTATVEVVHVVLQRLSRGEKPKTWAERRLGSREQK